MRAVIQGAPCQAVSIAKKQTMVWVVDGSFKVGDQLGSPPSAMGRCGQTSYVCWLEIGEIGGASCSSTQSIMKEMAIFIPSSSTWFLVHGHFVVINVQNQMRQPTPSPMRPSVQSSAHPLSRGRWIIRMHQAVNIMLTYFLSRHYPKD